MRHWWRHKMKNLLWLLLLSSLAIAATPTVDYQHFDGLKIGDKGQPAGSDVIVDVKSTTAGLLLPRMTSTQRFALSSPPDGLLVFDTTLQTVVEYNTTLAAWTFLV